MAARASTYFLVSLCFLFLSFPETIAIKTFPGSCEMTIEMNNQPEVLSGILDFPMPASMALYQDPNIDRYCDVRIMFGAGFYLQIELYYLDIMPDSADQTVCSTGLEVFESFSTRNVYGSRLCKEGWEWEERQIQNNHEKRVIQSSPVTFRLISGSPYRGTGYKVHFNVFRPHSVCMAKEFQCEEVQRCVSDDVTCDDWDDCGDESDESEDAGCGLLSATEIVAIIVGIILILETVIIIVLFCLRFRRLKVDYIRKSQLSLANSSQNLKPTPEPVLTFPHRFNSMESMNKSNYSKRTGTRYDSDSSIDKNELEKSDRLSYKDNASERSYRSRQSESRRNGHYQKRRSRGSSPASLRKERLDPISGSLKGSQPELDLNSDRDVSDRGYREHSRSRDRRYRDDRYSDSDDRSPPRRRRSRDRRRYDSDDDSYDSEYEEERRRRRRRRRSQDRYSRDRYDDDYSNESDYERDRRRRRDRRSPDDRDNSDDDLDRERRRRRSSRDRYRDDYDRSDDDDLDEPRQRRSSRDRYLDDRDVSDEDRARDGRRRRSRERDRDRSDPGPDSQDEIQDRPRRRRKPSQERDRRKEEKGSENNGGLSNTGEPPVLKNERPPDNYNAYKNGMPAQRGEDRDRDQRRPQNVPPDQNDWRQPDEKMGSRENILSQQNHRNTPPRMSPSGEHIRRMERPRTAPKPHRNQPPANDNRSQWKPRTERRKKRQSQDEAEIARNDRDSPPPVYEDVSPKVQLENLAYREEAV